ncbi:MAG TPA: response regulator [Ktedonobacterales bacterium]
MQPTPPYGEMPPFHDLDLPRPDEMARPVMVIDDSVTIRAVVDAGLRRAGYRVSAYADGLAAMGALARGEVEVPDLVLVDLDLPRMDGYEVTRILRGKPEFAGTHFIILTCYDGAWNRLRARLAGATEFIVKPFHMAYLVATVRRYVRAVWS